MSLCFETLGVVPLKIVFKLLFSEQNKSSQCEQRIIFNVLLLRASTVAPAMAGPLGERPPALVGHFCNVPTTVFAVLMSLYPTATCHEGPLSIRTGGGRSWQVLL